MAASMQLLRPLDVRLRAPVLWRHMVSYAFSCTAARHPPPCGRSSSWPPHPGDCRDQNAACGLHIKTVMAIGGWKRPDVLLRHYVTPSDEAKRRAILAITGGPRQNMVLPH